jgi:hypothetical protein
MGPVRSLVVALALATFSGCGCEAPEQTGGEQEPTARDEAVIRYVGMPGHARLDEPYGGTTTLDPETGLPRRTGGCIVMPGELEEIELHNARVRAACARGELRAFQLTHKFMRPEDLATRFRKDAGDILAPGRSVESPDHAYRIEVRLEAYPRATQGYWQGYVHARGDALRRFGLTGKPGEVWRVLFDHENTTLLVKKGEDAFEVHDLPTREVVQSIRLP